MDNGGLECDGGITVNRANPELLISNNLIYGNGRNGITFLDAAGGPHYVINNTIRANGWNGVRVAREHSVTFLLNNLIVHNGVQPNTTGGRYGILREGSTKPDPAGLMLLNNLVCGNTVGEMNGPALDTTDLHNLTPTGKEGPGVQASPGCDQADSLFTHVLGDDGKSGTLDDDFTLAPHSPAIDLGTDPREEIPEVDPSLFLADFTRTGARPQDGDASGTFEFDSGAIEVGHAPIATDDSYEVDENTMLTVPAPGVLANDTDPDGNMLTASRIASPMHGMLSLNPDGSFSYTPETNFVGTDTFTYKANDGHNDSNPATVTITVKRTNHLPQLVLPDPIPSCIVGQLCSIDIDATDPDVGDILTFSLTMKPDGMTINPSTGVIEWTPTAAQQPMQDVEVKVDDGHNGADTQSFSVAVASPPVNHAPTLVLPDPVPSCTVGQLCQIDIDATDPDAGDILSFSLAEKPDGMSIDAATGVIEWTPTAAQAGDNLVTVNVDDGHGGIDTQSLTVMVSQPGQTCTPPSSGMVSWWPGDGNADDIVGANNGTLQNGATFAPGMVGQALSFDGVNDYVTVAANPAFHSGAITLDFWLKAADLNNPSSNGSPSIISSNHINDFDGYQVQLESTGRVVFVIGGNTIRTVYASTPSDVVVDQWYHVAITYDGVGGPGSLKLYLNGVQKSFSLESCCGIREPSGPIFYSGDYPLNIGRRSSDGINKFHGLIDEVEIFNRALSDAEIHSIFAAGSAGKCKTPSDQHAPVITSTPTTARWEQLHPTGTPPTPRYWSSMQAYDEINDRQIFFSGEDNSPTHPHTADVWVLVNATGTKGTPAWVKLAPEGTGPVGRMGFSSAYDPTANRLIVYGGCLTHCGQLSDTWVLTNANGLGGPPTWIALPSGVLKAFGAAGYDPISNRMIVFGGLPAGPGSDTNEVRILLDANGIGTPTWMTLQTSGTAPSPRGHALSAVYDPLSNRLILFGGPVSGGANAYFDDVWVLDHANGLGGSSTWTKLNPIGTPPARGGHSTVYDPNSNRLVIFGGLATTSYVNEVWTLTHANGIGGTPEWRRLTTPGDVPTERVLHSVGYARASNRMVIALGRNDLIPAPGAFNDAWVLTNANGQCTAGQPCNYDVDATDPDAGDTLTFSLDTAPNGMTIDPASGLIDWTPTPAQIGDHNVQVRVTDPSGLFATQSFTFTVAPVAVPNVVGLDPASAEALIGAADLTIGTETHTGGEIKLNFDTLPSAQGWFFDRQNTGGTEQMFSIVNGVLHQDTIAANGDVFAMYKLRAVDPRLPFQLRSRVRVVEGGLVGVGLYAETDTKIFSFHLNPNAVLINGQTWTTVSTQDNKVFHDYLLERHRSDRYNLIVDGTIRVQDGLPLPTGGILMRGYF